MQFIQADYKYFADLAEKIYKPKQLIMANLTYEPESKEYNACQFNLNNLRVLFRTAHITPKKVGQFVTLWKRNGTGPIQPYDFSDAIDIFVISVHNNEQNGQFIFSKNILLTKGILSQHGKGGKRAMRIYCPWDKPENKQAKNTQAWQLNYFLNLTDDSVIDEERLKKLYRDAVASYSLPNLYLEGL